MWVERRAGAFFLAPAAVVVLVFSIFPLVASFYLSLTRFQFVRDGYVLRFIGWKNYRKLFFGSEQYHFLGVFGEWSAAQVVILAAVAAVLLWWLVRARRKASAAGTIGRVVTAAALFGITLLACRTLGAGGEAGSTMITLIYVAFGCLIQFAAGLGLALLCARPLYGGRFFRLVFFMPLMVTPVGIAYAFRMLADMSKGPFAPLWRGLGLGDFSWASDPVLARAVVLAGDSWQWIPFVFIVMLAAVENVDTGQREAAQMDGAGAWQSFQHVVWPAIMPTAATVVLIRAIEAFKIVDLPNILTSGGPGIATESMTLHAFIAWRSLNLGESAAVAYALLALSAVLCVSFFTLVVAPRRVAV